eukprot:TRINITY_DN25611_c0_g1_i1.p1 TRINITY_DN25611_c0_g1~~TRINITY_DN25611_c0_g1_i1.p1  ORF type:complete len:382 (-),score=114.67 TRINITY_DN25611_c0_g1_i1:498-1643(-)
MNHGSQTRRPSPPRITEADVRREQEALAKNRGNQVPTTVLSLWQPLASFLAYGLQRIEGRVWGTEFRGPLWIHAGSKDVSQEDIEKWEGLYRDVHIADGNTNVTLPEKYPTSALVGLVEVVDVLPAEDFAKWNCLTKAIRREGRAHGSGFLFLVERQKRLAVPIKMSGQHKLWRLDRKVATNALKGLVDMEQRPLVRWAELKSRAAEAPPASNADERGNPAEDSSDDEAMDNLLLEMALQQSAEDSGLVGSAAEKASGGYVAAVLDAADAHLQEALQRSLSKEDGDGGLPTTPSSLGKCGRWREKTKSSAAAAAPTAEGGACHQPAAAAAAAAAALAAAEAPLPAAEQVEGAAAACEGDSSASARRGRWRRPAAAVPPPLA